ncbi:MAG: mechanosensitive ion channel family protein [Pseudomonas sp.]
MLSAVENHPLVVSTGLLLLDVLAWRLVPRKLRVVSALIRLLLFLLYSAVVFEAGMIPTRPPAFSDETQTMVATGMEIIWWLFGARTLTVVLGLLIPRIGHASKLFQDILGAVIFLVAMTCAVAYVLQLPIKGLLATSGVAAIVIGLALQSTLSDVFSGIVLNTTKPYQLDDWISIDKTEGKVIDIDWRATHLLTSQGTMVVIPNSVAARTKIHNLSRPYDIHGVSIHLYVPISFRPRWVLDALEKALQGIGILLSTPRARVLIKSSDQDSIQYEATGFVRAGEDKAAIRNLMYDLAYRHLEASGILLAGDGGAHRSSAQRQLIEGIRLFSALSSEEKDELSRHMQPTAYASGQVVLELGEVASSLLILGSGVILATVPEADENREAGRLGPGDILGEEGVAGDAPSLARFTALTTCLLYHIEKAVICHYLDEHVEVLRAHQPTPSPRRTQPLTADS